MMMRKNDMPRNLRPTIRGRMRIELYKKDLIMEK